MSQPHLHLVRPDEDNPGRAGQAVAPAESSRDVVLDRYGKHVNRSLASLGRLMNLPVEVRSAGTHVYDADGTEYLDCGGFGVFLLGHGHPTVVQTVTRQLADNALATRLFLNPELAAAAQELASVSPAGLDYAFLTNSGAEAVEVALKLARLAGKTRLISTVGGFHGKTFGALSVTGRPSYREPFEPLLPEVHFVPYGDATALRDVLAVDGHRSAVVLEPVQAEGGVCLPPAGYLRAVRAACDEVGAMLILDEIQTGFGRLGTWWGAEAEQVVPDVLLAGKILSGGVIPVGAVIASEAAFAPLNADPMLHSSTFAGSPLAASAVRATIAAMRQDDLVNRSKVLGEQVLELTRAAVMTHCPHLVTEVRGRGLLLGIEFISSDIAADFMMSLLDRRVLPSYSLNANSVLRLTPPALLSEEDLRWLAEALDAAARELAYAVPALSALPSS